MAQYNYAKEQNVKNRQKVHEISASLPSFVNQYLMAKASSTSSSSQLSYLYDIREFLEWWQSNVPELEKKELSEMNAEDLGHVTALDINEYLYTLTGTQNPKTLARKCTALSSLFSYMYRMDMIESNPIEKVDRPKIRKDNIIIKLENDEITLLLDAIKNGCPGMSEQQQKYLEHTKKRDYAIVMLLLSTGIRVSECVGLDIDDIFFKEHKMQITRKGGKRQALALGDEMIAVLHDYLTLREKDEPEALKDKRALFLSTRKTRLCPAAVENMVSKYTTALGFGKRITPHKLRKTYGTNLYNETRDIYLVANALGHESVNTTTQHYVGKNDEDLQNARNIITYEK